MKYWCRLITILFAILFAGCAQSIKKFTNQGVEIRKNHHTINLSGTGKQEINVQYLGCSGFLISQNKEAVLIDPFFSNPRLGQVARSLMSKTIRPNEKLLTLLKDSINIDYSYIKALLITHTHYDHVLDAPYIYNNFLPVAKPFIYGSNSLNTLIKKLVPDSTKISVLDSTLSDYYHEEQWVNVSDHIRFLPIASDHSPHFHAIKFFDGEVCSPIEPEEYLKGTKVQRWAEGANISYLIEFTQSDTFRIFIQSAAASPKQGFPPHSYIEKNSIDLALLCMASFEYVCSYPDGIISYLKPRHIIIEHWEDFFHSYKKRLKKGFKIVRATKGKKFIPAIERSIKKYDTTSNPKEKYTIAEPLTKIKIKY